MRESEATDIVAWLVGAYPHRPLPPSSAAVYALALADVDFDGAKAAVMRLIQTSRWLPTIAEIREEVAKARVSLPGAEEAWGVVRRAISRYGSYRSPSFDCDEIDAAVDAIGWRELCLSEDHTASRARFCAAFTTIASRRMHNELCGQHRVATRQLPPPGDPADGRVLVETGYATARATLPARAESNDSETLPVVIDLAARLTRKL